MYSVLWGSSNLTNKSLGAARYRNKLISLSRTLKKKPPQCAKCHDEVILQNNARLHVSQPVKSYLESLDSEIPPHLPYGPDIAQSEYHRFRSIRHGLAEQPGQCLLIGHFMQPMCKLN